MHQRRIGMAARAELNDPGPIFLAIFLRPFLDEVVPDIGGGIATMTTGTGECRDENEHPRPSPSGSYEKVGAFAAGA